jgi:hypothetical protein
MPNMTSAECKGTCAGPLVAEVRQCELGAIVPEIAKTGGKIKIFAPESIAPKVPLDHERDVKTRP